MGTSIADVNIVIYRLCCISCLAAQVIGYSFLRSFNTQLLKPFSFCGICVLVNDRNADAHLGIMVFIYLGAKNRRPMDNIMAFSALQKEAS